jgi:hypothetical protein
LYTGESGGTLTQPSPGVPHRPTLFGQRIILPGAAELRAQAPLPCIQGRGWVRGSGRKAEG